MPLARKAVGPEAASFVPENPETLVRLNGALALLGTWDLLQTRSTLRRKGIGIELSRPYWLDGVKYCEAAEREAKLPSAPGNISRQALLSAQWWASEAGVKAEERWLSFVQKK